MLNYIDYLCAVLVKLANLAFSRLPTEFALWFGRQVGRAVYYAGFPRRAFGHANLRAAFCGEKTPREIKKITKGVYKHLAEIFCEIVAFTKMDKRYIEKYIDVVNPENFLKVKGHPDGVVLLTAHFGNWELSGAVSAVRGFPLIVLAREQGMKNLNALLDRIRELKGLEVIRKGITTRYIVEALHQGKMIGMVGDQDAGKAGELIPFFGRPVSTASGSARIASRTGAYMLPAFIRRVKGPYHRLTIEEPIKIQKGEDIRPYLLKYNKLLEEHVRACPEQWLWVHKRWKTTPLKKVVILTDGKAGHLNQSEALLGLLKRYREDSGYAPDDTKADILEIKFRNRFAKILVNFLGLFSGKACQGCMRCLKACLTKESYDMLMVKYADVVIGSGSAVAGVNRIFSLENNAKSAHVMRPSVLRTKKFDMVVLPSHDGAKTTGSGNVIVTDTTPNLIDEKYLDRAAGKMSQTLRLGGKKIIGVLLGGDNSDFVLTEEATDTILNSVTSAAGKLDAEFLFTTSRRTPAFAEKRIKARLRPERRCRLLVIPNEENISHAVGGILGLADVVVVSGESASMVSEAVASGKTVIVFRLNKRKKRKSKFEKMLDNMEGKGYITTTDTEGLSEAICRSFRKPTEKRVMPEDSYNIYKYMWRLL